MEMPLTRRSVLMPTYRFFYRVNSHCQYYSLNTKILPGYLVSATCFQLQKDTWYIVKNNNLLHIIWRKSHILYGSMKVVLRFFPLLKLGRHKRPTGTRYTLAWNENRPTRRNKHRKRERETWTWKIDGGEEKCAKFACTIIPVILLLIYYLKDRILPEPGK